MQLSLRTTSRAQCAQSERTRKPGRPASWGAESVVDGHWADERVGGEGWGVGAAGTGRH